ncbi:MAG: PAS domain S-box protein [Hyphomicrobiales bacterium]|jgi:PAS domain S-box-containing protein
MTASTPPVAMDFRGLFDASPNPYLVLDRRLHIAGANRAYLASVKRELDDIVGRFAWDAFPTDEETLRQATASFERVIATGQPDTMALLRFDVPRPEAEGGGMEERYWSITHVPVLDHAGEAAFVLQHPIDVTDLQHLRSSVEQQDETASADLRPSHTSIFSRARSVYEANLILRASDERFRSVLQIETVGAIFFDDDGRLTDANDTFLRMGGYTREDLHAGRLSWQGLTPVEWIEPSRNAWAELKATGRTTPYEKEYIRKDGTRWWALFAAKRLPDGTGFEFVLDITDRKRAEAALHDLNETLEQQVEQRTFELNHLWDTSPDLLLIIDFEGVFRRVNPAWTSLLGYQPDELVGHHVNEFVLPDDHASTVDAYTLTADGGRPRIVNRYRHKDGSVRWISWVAAPGGDMTYATGRDITAEKEQASALLQAEEALRQSQKMEAVGQLTGGVAHDFNNLLTIIRSSVDFLRRPGLPEARKGRYLDAVSDTVERAAKLTGQLLAFARRQTLKPEVFDVGERVRRISDMLDTVTGARIRVVTDVPVEPCFVRADLSQFETALVNMAVNARDAMDGEGTLTLRVACSSAMPPIRGHAGSQNAFAAVSLTDTGSGIAADQLGRIFEPFFTTKEIGKGTGLGLSQVFGFAKQSGGDVDVHSTPGEGTTFTLYLPEIADEGAHERQADNDDGPAPVGTGQRVLVVEDNIEVGRFCTQILQDLGYRTEWAANAEEALDLLGADGGGFEVVFSDVVMPGMGGIALAQELRRRLPHLPVILASGYSHVLARDGAHGFELVHKPYSADQLSKVLRHVTRPKRGRKRG